VTSGSVASGADAFHVVLQVVASNLSVSTRSGTASVNGDMTMDINRNPGSASIVATGSSLAGTVTTAAGTRSATWTGYREGVSTTSTSRAATLDGTVVVTNSRLSINNASYIISTQVPVQWTTSGANPFTGVVTIGGAAKSAARVTFSASGVSIDIDANGDGVYEKTVSTTVDQLRSML
jgi:hypothetical protein